LKGGGFRFRFHFRMRFGVHLGAGFLALLSVLGLWASFCMRERGFGFGLCCLFSLTEGGCWRFESLSACASAGYILDFIAYFL
jgi:hypothetical protein